MVFFDRKRSLTALFCLPLLLLAGCSDAESEAKSNQPAPTPIASQPAAKQAPVNLPVGHGFDFYVLALSWSPTYCLNEGSGRDSLQCGANADFGFIVHGLWPQNERGYPEFCPTREGDRVPERLGRSVIDIAPSMGLIGHMWRKHGSCSGLSMSDYFRTVKAAFEKVRIPGEYENLRKARTVSPDKVESAFIAANPGLSEDAMAVTCEGARLDEVRICLSADLNFTTCREVDRSGCRRGGLTMPPQ